MSEEKKSDFVRIRNSGKKKDQALWEAKFLAAAQIAGGKEAFLPDFDSKLPDKESASLDEPTAEGKAHKKALKMNEKAVNALILAMESMDLMNKITLEQTTSAKDWGPTGKAWKMLARI